VARTPNYGFEKRRREQERQAKKEAKARRREELKALGITEDEALLGGGDDAVGGVGGEGGSDGSSAGE
jgi:hypothetical protein